MRSPPDMMNVIPRYLVHRQFNSGEKISPAHYAMAILFENQFIRITTHLHYTYKTRKLCVITKCAHQCMNIESRSIWFTHITVTRICKPHSENKSIMISNRWSLALFFICSWWNYSSDLTGTPSAFAIAGSQFYT
jgi:hypothetical protein